MLECIKEMHEETKFMHRDIKPLNFRIHKGKVYVTDFGLAIEYEKDGAHVLMARNQPLMGSMRYVSHWTHEGMDLSRRDDIEMLGYSIMKMLQPNPKDELWSVAITADMSIAEMNVMYYQQKKNFLES